MAPLRRNRQLGLAALFAALAFVAFGPALRAPFDFDDLDAITNNTTIRTLWPPAAVLHTPPNGTPVSGRPVANLSFAMNYAVNRWLGVAQAPATVAPNETVGYHIVNILLHIVAALLLAAVITRTMRVGRVPAEWRDSAERIAVCVAAIWMLHPLQTEAVDYVSQRTEVLASAFYLLTLYAAVRAWSAAAGTVEDAPPRTLAWSVVAVLASLFGVATKEVVITAPLMVMLYDRAFLSSGWGEPWRMPTRRRLYIALIATSAVSLALVAAGGRDTTVGFAGDVSWYAYLYSQAWAVPHYVALFFWPSGLTFDYGRHAVHGLAGVPGLIALTVAAVVTFAAWRSDKWRWLAFVGSWFFVLLAPSSSVVPIQTEIAAERRVYLALAAVVVLVVISLEQLRRRFSGAAAPQQSRAAFALRAEYGVVVAISAVLIALSFRRSAMYDDLRVRWLDGIAKTPANGRVYHNLAAVDLRANPPRMAEADNWLQQAMTIDSSYVPAWVLAAKIAASQNRLDDAALLLADALKIRPRNADATEELGKVLLAQGRAALAIPYLRQVADLRRDGESQMRLGVAFLMTRQLDSAVAVLERAARTDSTQVAARRNLGATLVELDRGAEAIPYLQQAVRLDSTSGVSLALLSLAHAQAGHADTAVTTAEAAVQTSPDNATVYLFAGRALFIAGRYAAADDYLAHAVRLAPNDAQALTRLGMAEASLGHRPAAEQLFQRALMLVPGYPLASQKLEQLRGRHR